METFIAAKPMVEDPAFADQRKWILRGLTSRMIDKPIAQLITGFNELPCFYTLQCCYGHFVHEAQPSRENLARLPESEVRSDIEYRIAYIAFVLENSPPGRELMDKLKRVPLIDPLNIQFCSAEWFWERQVNSYALQVEPDRFKDWDTAVLSYAEARIVERIRDRFFKKLQGILTENQG